MVDRISSTTPVTPAVRVAAVARTRIRPAPAETAPVSPAAAMAAAGPPVDVAKVERIRAAIRDGSYRAQPAEIAAKMADIDLPDAK